MTVEKIVLAYSGGLDTSVILKWLSEQYECPVIAYAADVGQHEDWDAVREKGLATGAEKVIVSDLREEFVRDFIFPAFRANAIYEGSYLLGTSLARPIIGREQVRIAAQEGADAVSHGATGKGNDQVRFELTYLALNPKLKIIAPWRIWDLNSRKKLVAFAEEHGIPIPTTKKNPYSSDENILHISFEGGILEDPWNEPEESMFKLSVSPEKAPDTPTYIEIDFEQGNPVAINGERLGEEAAPLEDGDQVRIGKTVMTFRDQDMGIATQIFLETAEEMKQGAGFHTIMNNILHGKDKKDGDRKPRE